MPRDFRFSIDRGGTFTDIYAEIPVPPYYRVYKLLSVDPANYEDAPREGIRRILEEATGQKMPKNAVDTSRIEWIRMGTTVATNALLERKGVRSALITTKGFRDLLRIGNQSRPKIFDLVIRRPELVYERVVEVEERVRLLTEGPDSPPAPGRPAGPRHQGVTGEWIEVLTAPDPAAVRAQLEEVLKGGVTSLAVVLMHAYTYPAHEELIGRIAVELGFKHVSLSSATMRMVRMVPRGFTTCVDAYLTPLIRAYIDDFRRGFAGGLSDVRVEFMQSDGGLTPADLFSGCRAILSGPAGGVVGYSVTAFSKETNRAVIGFDMGGTSTDVSRFAGRFEHVFDTETAGVQIQAPQLAVTTVAAGGGSRLFFQAGIFEVGPESVGAHPGPVCYRKGGNLAVTDANLLLGRLLPEFFPKIFGPSEDQPLDADGTRAAFEKITDEINAYFASHGGGTGPMTPDEVAYGFIRVANEAMCRPIRSITQAKGYDVTDHILACFGGAGAQHACALARALGMRTILVHRFAGILSAYGLALADVVSEGQEPCAAVYGEEALPGVRARLDALAEEARGRLRAQGFSAERVRCDRFLNLRYEGTDAAIMTPEPEDGDFLAAFRREYMREYGFTIPDRPVRIDDIRVRAVGKTSREVEASAVEATAEHIRRAVAAADAGPAAKRPKGEQGAAASPAVDPAPRTTTRAYFEGGRVETPVHLLEELAPAPGSGAFGAVVRGPAIIIDKTSTIVVEPGCVAGVTPSGDVVINVEGGQQARGTAQADGDGGPPCDSVQLSIFAHRFMGIAEQMGRTLQRTAISTNIKERLDFSCALFGPDGGLVANAPHLPVHLGSMQDAVRAQIEHLAAQGGWREGDVLVSNHPAMGGSHLPDITVITPVFHAGRPVFYVASRGHHADIGGITPGSMPPFSKALEEEGAAIKSFVLVRDGVFQEAGITALLEAPGKIARKAHEAPSSGTRTLRDNLSDLRAQVAANHRGIALVSELIESHGLPTVHAYMKYIQEAAESAVREMLRRISEAQGLPEQGAVEAVDYMDDGTPIRLRLHIDRRDGSAVFDFSGTGPEVYGNSNSPKAVAKSAILYSLRCLVTRDIPLNQGCLVPIRIVIPEGTILSPSEGAAVVGGNVLTSQRVTDVVLKAFAACAASQGCMNNLTFGDDRFGYYETIAGGAGAGPTWHGQSGVHTHMTNTRITDPEILERRYPVMLREFGIRGGSGGEGAYRGGDGVVRDIEFLRPLTVGILSERRVTRPYGLAGGDPGQCGLNLLVRADGRRISLGPKNTVAAEGGDRIRIETPGGGGYGARK